MQTKTIVIIGVALAALYVLDKEKDKAKGKPGSFEEGFLAGWVAPGPFSVLTAAGLAHYFI